ncbi:hypothetical protein AMECASPLE_038428 [Ameca splendens]|uniref:Uncharacterized protein n=1 Tax=Ameca splendens TaxID=208324 RepID=A0ABV0XX30_9TELE
MVLYHPSLNHHLNVVEGFECSNDPRGYVVWGLNAPGRVSHGKQALGDGSHPGARPGWPGCSSRDPVGPSPNERCKAIPQGPTTCRGNREGSVQRGLGGGRRWRP